MDHALSGGAELSQEEDARSPLENHFIRRLLSQVIVSAAFALLQMIPCRRKS